ncbi:MAG: hypothetical protein B7Y39_16275 [Bdellovibrio sp. 28-41-41]|nr:MAG: hypothetical protein B7Y39_16275 [Bdellovibrio sp. 28-41-41]
MSTILKIAVRNLTRYTRRTLLTATLISIGVIFVIVFGGLASSFKNSMINVITGSLLADIQIHKKGYVESIDNLPLNIFLSSEETAEATKIISGNPNVVASSPRIKFSAMLSNYAQTSGVRLVAIYPDKEIKTCPDLAQRIKGRKDLSSIVNPGEILVPELLFKGLSLKLGDEIVVVATNRDGAVNGVTLRVAGYSEGVMGPSGKDGYIHIEDATSLLRMEIPEISEIAIKLKEFKYLSSSYKKLADTINGDTFEVHTWEHLTPFSTIVKIVDVLILMVRVILTSIVLVSIMNIMMMSVYERIGEIGMIAALGTLPRQILSIFFLEGILLGLISTVVGAIVAVVILTILTITKLEFKFGSMNIALTPGIPWSEMLITVTIVMVISAIATLQPAIKASKLEPVDALGHV